MLLLSKWQNHKEDNNSITSELKGIQTLLSYNQLDYKIGGIYLNNQLEAIIIASLLNDQTIHIHVEKANPDIRGLYPAILKLFLENNYPKAIYINREDDLGIDNLRKAKNALHPLKKIHKYQIQLKHFSVQCDSTPQEELKKLWINSFDDENEVTSHHYFDIHYPNAKIYALYNKKTLISVAHVYEHKMRLNHEIWPYTFIVGVSTRKEYQGQGCMRYLMEYIKNKYKTYIYLQAYEPQIYESLGFRQTYYQQVINVNKSEYSGTNQVNEIKCDAFELLKLYEAYTKNLNGYRIRTIDYYDNECFRRLNAYNEKIKVFAINYNPIGYIIYDDKDKINIHEFIYSDKNILEEIIKYLCDYFTKEIIITCDLKTEIKGDKLIKQNMLTNMLNTSTNGVLYINEIF